MIPEFTEQLKQGKPPDSFVVMAVVHQIQPEGAPAFGNASIYVYDLWVNVPGGLKFFAAVQPSSQRYPDGVNVVPFQVGAAVPVAVVGTQLSGYGCYILDREILHVVPCGGAP